MNHAMYCTQHSSHYSPTGNLTDLSKQRRLHKIEEGQTLEEDQAVAMSLEDKMAWRIQRRIRYAVCNVELCGACCETVCCGATCCNFVFVRCEDLNFCVRCTSSLLCIH